MRTIPATPHTPPSNNFEVLESSSVEVNDWVELKDNSDEAKMYGEGVLGLKEDLAPRPNKPRGLAHHYQSNIGKVVTKGPASFEGDGIVVLNPNNEVALEGYQVVFEFNDIARKGYRTIYTTDEINTMDPEGSVLFPSLSRLSNLQPGVRIYQNTGKLFDTRTYLEPGEVLVGYGDYFSIYPTNVLEILGGGRGGGKKRKTRKGKKLTRKRTRKQRVNRRNH
jgi:hypothetical protein